ncbi:MAG: FKBP-type peptidyl-prolyl cis-trans isomerase [Chitinophagaceae bacterium]|nr:FKBP-type peptidyl-prolyl cis-trans isomerase [Chitinophagaceae bacterium]
MKKTTGYISIMIFTLGMLACGGGGSGVYKKIKDGSEYKIISDGKGDMVKYGEVMKFRMALLYKDSVLGGETGPRPPQYQPIDSTELPKDFFEIFSKVRKGDSIVIRILTDSAFKSGMGVMPKEFKKGEYLVRTIKVLGIVSKEKAQEDFAQEVKVIQEQDSIRAIGQKVRDDEAIQAYLAKNNIKAERTEAGTYYEVQQAGGESAKAGQSISVKYTGSLLDGTVFDSNVDSSFHHTEPYTFTLGTGGSIKGFDDGLRQFGKGAKGRIFIPSGLGYGSQGQGKLKPNSNLIFEVEVLDVKDAPAPPPPPVKPQITPVKPAQKAPVKKN